MVLEKTLESPLTARSSNQSVLKESNSEIIGRTDAEGEAPTLWPPDAVNSLGKTLMLAKIEGKREGNGRG